MASRKAAKGKGRGVRPARPGRRKPKAPRGKAAARRGVSLRARGGTGLVPCLWFDGQAEEAARFYVSVFPGSRMGSVSRYGDAGPGPKGSAMAVTFRLQGQEFMALNGGPQYTFTPAVSFLVRCRTQEEVDRYWDRLLEGGGTPSRCGWLADRFGLSWQVVPDALGEMLADRDPARARRVMEAMLGMAKLDLGALKAAYRGA